MSGQIYLEKSRIPNQPTLKFLDSGKELYIHSKYDPIAEAKKWTYDVIDSQKSIYVIFGGGLLYHVEELLKNLSKNVDIFVLEPNQDIFEISKRERDNYVVIEDPRVKFIYYQDEESVYDYLKRFFMTMNMENMKVCSYSCYEQLYPEKYMILLKILRRLLTEKSFYINTKEIFAIESVRNILNNAKYVADSTPIEALKLKWRNCPAIVVSAGPSLEKNIDLLKGRENEFIIISGGRTLKTLLDRGIRPHFVVSVDGSYENFQLFEEVLGSDVPLVTTWVSHRDIVSNYEGRLIFSNNSDIDDLDMDLFGCHIPNLYASGTVATMQLDLARYLGCSNIALIGQDLAETGGKSHAEGASHGPDLKSRLASTIRVKGNVEPYVYTHEVFKHYIDIFEWYISKTKNDIKVYNCTEGGAFIEGTEVVSLSRFLEENKISPRLLQQEIVDVIENQKFEMNREEILEKFREMSRVSIKVCKNAKKGRLLTERVIKGKIASDEERAKFKKIDNLIVRNDEYLKIANLLSKRTMDNIGRARLNQNKSEEEQLVDAYKLQRAIYATIEGTCAVFNELINESIRGYENN